MNSIPLYKFVPTEEIARKISVGVYRFYELTKYRKIEDTAGRSDPSEGSICFTDAEIENDIEKLPVGSFNGIEFLCAKTSLSDDYIGQYFVFCMSIANSARAIDGCNYSVELSTDIFDALDILLPTPDAPKFYRDGIKLFSHAPVEYYDIYNHPNPLNGERWKEAYIKHSMFSYQREYRAAIFVSNHFFERTRNEPAISETPIFDGTGNQCGFNLKLLIRSGIDENGWRYLEFDVSEFQANLLPEPSKISTLEAEFSSN